MLGAEEAAGQGVPPVLEWILSLLTQLHISRLHGAVSWLEALHLSFEGAGTGCEAAFPQLASSTARWGGCRRRTERCNILALKQKLPRDALIFATVDSHCSTGMWSTALLGREQQPRLWWGELGQLANYHLPQYCSVPDPGGLGVPAQSPLDFRLNHNGAALSHLCPGHRG